MSALCRFGHSMARRVADAITSPARMHAAPSSWASDGDSSSSSREDNRAERLERQHHGRQRRRQARQRDRDQQPAEDLRAERERDQPAGSRERRRQVEAARQGAVGRTTDRRRRASRRRRPAGRHVAAVPFAQREQEAQYAIPVRTPKSAPSAGFAPYAPSSKHAGDEDDAHADDRDRRERRARRSAPSAAQASSATSTTCVLPSTVANPAPTCSIALCQRIRSAAKNAPAHQASRRSRSDRGPNAAPPASASTQSTGSARAAPERACRRGDVRVDVEDPGEGDRRAPRSTTGTGRRPSVFAGTDPFLSAAAVPERSDHEKAGPPQWPASFVLGRAPAASALCHDAPSMGLARSVDSSPFADSRRRFTFTRMG